jgi:rRNA biogenesis protein RRP5
VLVVDPERKRISLTAKKTLVESTLPVIATLEDAKIGTVVHAVVFKVFEKHLMVEFFNNLKAVVPAREIRYVLRFSVLFFI